MVRILQGLCLEDLKGKEFPHFVNYLGWCCSTKWGDPLQAQSAFSSAFGSILTELVRCLKHMDPLSRTNNEMVYSILNNATRNTVYVSTIKSFQGGKIECLHSWYYSHPMPSNINGRECRTINSSSWWTPGGTVELMDWKIHRTIQELFIAFQECQLYVNFQSPMEHTWAGYLLDNITSNDLDLWIALSNICLNQNHMCDDLEAAVAHMLPISPYTRHCDNSCGGERIASISDATLVGKGVSKTWVDLRWHTKKE